MTRLRDRVGRWACLAALAAVVAACAHQTGTVILLPEKDGRSTAVVVRQGDQEVVLDRPYAAARQTTSGVRAYASNPQEVETLFGAALAAQPSRPTAYTLYFKEGGDEFTDESKAILADVLADIAKHPVPDIVVVGHTDSVGNDTANDALALRRAETVRAILVGRGLSPASIAVAGRGKREPLVPTPDGVAEPRNRRVEIIVR
jgi:outer membrane protein OmpA-like peptidoglycan-associated protein